MITFNDTNEYKDVFKIAIITLFIIKLINYVYHYPSHD